MRNKYGQIWSFDLIAALMIFLIGLVVIYYYALTYNSGYLDETSKLSYDALLVSDLLLGEDDFSIVADGKINQSKLEAFAALTDEEKKSILGVTHNFYFYFTDAMISGVPVSYIGIVNTSQPLNQIKTTRIAVYNNNVVTFEVIAWS